MDIIGIMTGNSMDACDIVLTRFEGEKIIDLYSHTRDFSNSMRADMDFLRHKINDECISMAELDALPEFHRIHDQYMKEVADTVNEMLDKNGIDRKSITAIGFHGKTLDHCPPSIAAKKAVKPYTLQIGSGQMLADLTGIPVVYDFRSDDIMAGGEGAPLVPPHNKNIAKSLGLTDAIFFNAGNTSNLSIMSGDTLLGWDAGPFNEFVDKLVRKNTSDVCDLDGKYGKQGTVDMNLVKILFDTSATTAAGDNFYNITPPRSSDPKWYHFDKIAEFVKPTNLNNSIRTAEFFSAYTAAYTLRFVPTDVKMPSDFILFGGGWNNPICLSDFKELLMGTATVLPEHEEIFKTIRGRFSKTPTAQISTLGKFMEARLFADTARYFLEQKTWSTPALTGCKYPTVLGRKAEPKTISTSLLYEDKINRAAAKTRA